MSKNSKNYGEITTKKLEKSKLEITGSIPGEHFESYRPKALKNLNDVVKIDGFRTGHIPEKVLAAKVGDAAILEEMAELAVSHAYPDIIIDHAIDAIGRPEIQITKLAKDNPLEFKIVTAVLPHVELGDYKKAAKEVFSTEETFEVTEAEMEKVIKEIRASKIDHSGHDHDSMSKEDHDKAIESTLPELTNEFVQALGDFTDVEDFKKKLKVNMLKDKAHRALEKKRLELSTKIIDQSTIEVPDIMINSELTRIEAQFRDDIARMGLKFEDYIKHAKKTIEDIRKEWLPEAEKKAKLQLVLNKIADIEKIKPDQKAIEEEVNIILEYYKDADQERAYTYAESVLTNEAVFKYLEAQK